VADPDVALVSTRSLVETLKRIEAAEGGPGRSVGLKHPGKSYRWWSRRGVAYAMWQPDEDVIPLRAWKKMPQHIRDQVPPHQRPPEAQHSPDAQSGA